MFDKFDWAVVIIACLFFVLISQTLVNIWSGQKSYSLVSDMSSVNESNNVYFKKLLNDSKPLNKVVTTTSITTTTMKLSVFNSNGTMVSLLSFGKGKNIMLNCGSNRFVSDMLFSNYGSLDYLILLKDGDKDIKACSDILLQYHVNKMVFKSIRSSSIFNNIMFLLNRSNTDFTTKYDSKWYGNFNYSVNDDRFIGNYGKTKINYVSYGDDLSSSTYDIDYLIIDDNINISESEFSKRKIVNIVYSDDRDLSLLMIKYGVKGIKISNGKYKEINVSFVNR